MLNEDCDSTSYIQFHRIHYTLETIVGSLIKAKPTDPLDYIISLLTKMQSDEDLPVRLSDLGSADALEYLRKQFIKHATDGLLSQESFTNILQACISDREGQQEKILQLDTIFNVFDRDHNKTVDTDEFNAGIRILFRGTEQDQMDFAFAGIDYNHDGSVSVDEFLAFFKNYFTAKCALNGSKLPNTRWAAIQDHLRRVFRASDSNANGAIDTEEFRAAVKRDPDHPFTIIWQSFKVNNSTAPLNKSR